MKLTNRLTHLNGVPQVLPVRKRRWPLVLWLLALTGVAIASFLVGHYNGYFYGENQFRQKTGYSTEQLNDAHNKVQELLEKAKQNGL